MAIVYSYPTATPEEQDLLVGTEMAVQGGEDAPRTRTFTVGSIIGLLTPALNLKANIESPTFTGTVGGITKAMVGLSNVDNTTDLLKPISTATQTALNSKVATNTAVTAGTKTKISYDAKGLVTNGVDATTADINDSTNRRYITDAQQVVLGNTVGFNNGDQNLQSVCALGANTTSGITAAGFSKPGGLSTQFLKANGSVDSNNYSKNIVRTSSSSGNPTGGTTALALRESTLIPGGVLQDKDCIDLTCFFGKVNSNAAGSIYVYINSTDSLSGATLIAYYSFPNDLIRGQLTRKWIIRSPYVSGFYNGGVSSNTGTENVTSTYYPSEFVWDVTTDKYLLIAMQMDSSSDGILYYGTNLKN